MGDEITTEMVRQHEMSIKQLEEKDDIKKEDLNRGLKTPTLNTIHCKCKHWDCPGKHHELIVPPHPTLGFMCNCHLRCNITFFVKEKNEGE